MVAQVDIPVVDGEDLDLAGGVGHDELGAARKPGAAAQRLLEDSPAGDDRDLVRRVAFGGAALKQVVGRGAGVGQAAPQLGQHDRVGVDASDERALVDSGDAGGRVGLELGQGLGGQLARVVEVGHQVEALAVARVRREQALQLGVAAQPPGVEGGHLRADAHDPDVIDLGQRLEDLAQAAGAHQQGVAAGEQDVADLGVGADVVEAGGHVVGRDPVFVLDEIDKLGAGPAGVLLEVLDPSQHDRFHDAFVELPFDLSGVLFITTANEPARVPPAPRDRLEIIELCGYTEAEKIAIAETHLVEARLLSEMRSGC